MLAVVGPRRGGRQDHKVGARPAVRFRGLAEPVRAREDHVGGHGGGHRGPAYGTLQAGEGLF